MQYFSSLNTFMRKGTDPDPLTYGSGSPKNTTNKPIRNENQ